MWNCGYCAHPNGDASICEVCGAEAPRGAETMPSYSVGTVREPPAPVAFQPLPEPARPASGPTGRVVVGASAVLIALVAVGVTAFVVVKHKSARADVDPPNGVVAASSLATEISTPPPTDEPTAGPSAVGIVAIALSVTDGRAVDLATMFDTYFSGINDKRYDAVGSVLDPAGSIDPGNPAQMAGLQRGTRSTRDSQIVLNDITDGGNDTILARVAFQSAQSPGDGPKGRSGETCTAWNVTYTVSTTSGYRILGSRGQSRPC
jgi:hypothetical protein